MGAIFNAQANHSPLLVTAGQQVRAHITMQANLTNRDATRVVHPFVKWSFEPPRAQDVPHALARAIHTASLAPKGPAFVSLPMDDWNEEADPSPVESSSAPPSRGWARTRQRSRRSPSGSPRRATRCWWPAPTSTPPAPGMTPSRWPSARSCPVFASPAPGGGRLGFPEGHPLFQGVLPPAIGPVAETLKGRDLILVVGLLRLPLLPLHPRAAAPRGRLAWSRSPATPTRPPAPRWAT